METYKKTKKIKFVDFWSGFKDQCENSLIMQILRKHYNVVVCDDPDYVFFSTFGESHWGVPDKCVKIFQTGENLSPDFNACDYAIGFEWMKFEDRYIRFPNYLFYDRDMLHKMEHKHEITENYDIQVEKPHFCSFVVSNHRNPKRKVIFDELSMYKRIDSGGRYLNNIGEFVKDKIAFEGQHKFSICYENGSHNGYTTEKLVQAFAARTVPIYWGDPLVGKVFNKNAFIDAYSMNSIQEVLDKVKEVDNNADLYLQMLRTPALSTNAPSVDEEIARFEKWLINIFEQPLEKAYRRNREMHGRWYVERRLKLDVCANRRALVDVAKTKASKVLKYMFNH